MKILNTILILLVLALAAFNLKLIVGEKSVTYVDIGKLQENFKLKKELDDKATAKLLNLKNILDSMVLAKKIAPASQQYTKLDTNIARFQYELNNQLSAETKNITQKVWERLNPIIEKFGKEHKYTLVVGANGAGNVLYGDSKADVTQALIEFANNAYATGH